METWKKVALGLIVASILWHLYVAINSKIRVAGLFLAKPSAPGYVWQDAENDDSRFFWQRTDTKWAAGIEHPDYKAESTEQEGAWNPLPGYTFVNKKKSLETEWQPGSLHPYYMALAGDVEGKWTPVAGYRFVYEKGNFVDAVWDPNKRFDDAKVYSLAEKDRYKPFPGYRFTEPGKSLKVAWTPGLINYENARLIAGQQEGSWNVNSQPARTHRSPNGNSTDETAGKIFGRAAARAFWGSL